jgi:hypothetical protein
MYGTVWLGLGCMLYAEDEWWVKRQWLGLRAGSLFGKLERVEQVERVEYESSVTQRLMLAVRGGCDSDVYLPPRD